MIGSHGAPALAVGMALAALLPAVSMGAEVSMEKVSTDEGSSSNVSFVSKPGEANQVAVNLERVDPRGSAHRVAYTFADAGTPLLAGPGCNASGANQVICMVEQSECPDVWVELADRDDTLVAAGETCGTFAVHGGLGADTLQGGPGAEQLIGGGGGRDSLYGGKGGDSLSDGDSPSAPDSDLLDGGGSAKDLVSYGGRSGGLSIDLAAGSGGVPGEADALVGIEGAEGGRGPDVILGTEGANYLEGGDGRAASRDILDGRGGRDDMFGTSGPDRLIGGAGGDELSCHPVNGSGCTLLGGPGRDRVSGGLHSDVISGGPGNDDLFGGAGEDRILGGAGQDRVSGGRDGDKLRGGSGNDKLLGGDGDDTLFGGPGRDLLFGDLGPDRLVGGPGRDEVTQ